MFKYIAAVLALLFSPIAASATTILTVPQTTFSFSDRSGIFDANYVKGSFTVNTIKGDGIYKLSDLKTATLDHVQLFIFDTAYKLKNLTSFSAYVVGNKVEAISFLTKDCFQYSFGKFPAPIPTTPTTPTSPVPEPAAWGMMILGFGMAGFAMRRKQNMLLAQA